MLIHLAVEVARLIQLIYFYLLSLTYKKGLKTYKKLPSHILITSKLIPTVEQIKEIQSSYPQLKLTFHTKASSERKEVDKKVSEPASYHTTSIEEVKPDSDNTPCQYQVTKSMCLPALCRGIRVDVDSVQNVVGMKPDVVLCTDSYLDLSGVMPWGLQITEIVHFPCWSYCSLAAIDYALRQYGDSKQRYGK